MSACLFCKDTGITYDANEVGSGEVYCTCPVGVHLKGIEAHDSELSFFLNRARKSIPALDAARRALRETSDALDALKKLCWFRGSYNGMTFSIHGNQLRAHLSEGYQAPPVVEHACDIITQDDGDKIRYLKGEERKSDPFERLGDSQRIPALRDPYLSGANPCPKCGIQHGSDTLALLQCEDRQPGATGHR